MEAYTFSGGLTLSEDRKINGSVTINGDLSGNGSLEVCGNLLVNGDICIDNIKVHGDLICHHLDVCTAFCGGNMKVSGYASAEDIVCSGSISIDFICAADTVSAKKEISCNYLSFNKVAAGSDLQCNKVTSQSVSPQISVGGKIKIG